MPSAPPWTRTHLAVPRMDRSLLAVPDLETAAAVGRANAGRLAAASVNIQGRPLLLLREAARREAVRLAGEFTAGVLGDATATADPEAPLIVPGHQPQLYHPGVWAKNFAAAGLAKRLGGSVLNLIVDNDLIPRTAIDAPAGTRARPTRQPVPFDQPQRPRPWEAAAVADRDLFRSFADRAAAAMQPWGVEPVIGTVWPAACERLAAGGSLPECLSAARHTLEASWGVHNLELPMSRLCGTDPFLWAAGHLLAHLPRFTLIHNAVLDEYRGIYGIKSRNHPVPELETRGDWLEAPFWVWRDDAPRRRRVFARQRAKRLTLADDAGETFAVLPLSPEMEACCAVEVLRDLPARGVRLRTRALTTTLFARLFLADLFVHGIGGAKYDELTDRLIPRFFGLPAPGFATVSASLYLPFAEPFGVTATDERRLTGALRDADQNPQRHLNTDADANPRVAALVAEKSRLIAEQQAAETVTGRTRSQRRRHRPDNARRYRRLRQVTAELTHHATADRTAAATRLATARAARTADRLLASREFSFALYPEATLRPFLTGLAAESAGGPPNP